MGKKIVTTIVLLFMLSSSFYAQQDRPRRVELGIFAGPTIGWASPKTKGYESTGARVGGVYGINADINLVQTESNYYFLIGINARHVHTGLQCKDTYTYINENDSLTINGATVKSKYNTIYLSIPTAIKLKTNEFGRFVIFGIVGLEHGFCLSSKSKDFITCPDGSELRSEVNQYKNCSIFRESLLLVFGCEFIIQGNTKASLGIAFDNSFNNLFRNKYTNQYSNTKVKAVSRSFEFQFGFVF